MSIVADGADGADGTVRCRVHSDDPVSRAAFTTESNLDAQRPKRRLDATQTAGERAGIFGPAHATPRNAVTVAIGADTQKVGGATRPRAALCHDIPDAGGHRVGVDDAFDH